VRAQDDTFRHVNGNWLRNTSIPADKARYGAFDQLRERASGNSLKRRPRANPRLAPRHAKSVTSTTVSWTRAP
jgi:predicted metalloendopeptidase